MVKWIIFDLDGTLYDEETYVISGFNAVSQHLATVYNLNQNTIFDELINSFKKDGRGKNFNHIINKFNLNQELIPDLVQVYCQHNPKISLYPTAKKLLKELSKTFKLGIITDGNIIMQQNKITALLLKNWVEFIIYTDDKGLKEKPDLSSYQKALKLSNSEPHQLVYIGDNPYRDFIGAKSLGLKTIRIKSGKFKDVIVKMEFEAETTLNDLDELEHFIKEKWR